MDALYSRFLASEEIRAKFRDTDFEEQAEMLARSLQLIAGATEGEPRALQELNQITWGFELRFIEHVPGAADELYVIAQNAGHFLQEDKGEELAALMLDFLARNGPEPAAVAVPMFSGAALHFLVLGLLVTGWAFLALRKVSPTPSSASPCVHCRHIRVFRGVVIRAP